MQISLWSSGYSIGLQRTTTIMHKLNYGKFFHARYSAGCPKDVIPDQQQ